MTDFEYNSPGSYFITLCTKENRNYFRYSLKETASFLDELDENNLFGESIEIFGTSKKRINIKLSTIGKIAEDGIQHIPQIYPFVAIDYYIIMPDHIHILLSIHENVPKEYVQPTIGRILNQLKGYVTKRGGCSIWRKSFFDHIIKNQDDYNEHVKYICENPIRWYYKHFRNML